MQYQYVAYNMAQGIVKGSLEAASEDEARSDLEGQGYKPLQIRMPSKISLDKISSLIELDAVKPAEVMQFVSSASTMLASGANLLRVLEMLQAEGSGRGMRKILTRLHERVSGGDSFTLALREHPKVFDDVFISLVEVGEYTGRLAGALGQLRDIMKQAHEAKQRAMKALMMPMFLIGSSFLMLGFMVFVAFPPLIDTFNSMENVEIPLVTRILIATVEGVVANIAYIGGGLVVLVVVYKVLRRFPTMKYWLDVAKIRLPLLGPLMLASELGRFTRIMTTLLGNGVDVPSALRLAMSSAKNVAVLQAWTEADESLIQGHRMAKALLNHSILPQMFIELMAMGEDTNTLPKTTGELADAYEKGFEEKSDKMLAIAEPVSTFAVGGLVLFMALSVMKPILSAAGQVQ